MTGFLKCLYNDNVKDYSLSDQSDTEKVYFKLSSIQIDKQILPTVWPVKTK